MGTVAMTGDERGEEEVARLGGGGAAEAAAAAGWRGANWGAAPHLSPIPGAAGGWWRAAGAAGSGRGLAVEAGGGGSSGSGEGGEGANGVGVEGLARISGARDLLASAHAALLRERLEAEAGRRAAMPAAELRELAREVGAAGCADEAAAVCGALHRAGVIMQVGSVAYLRPGAVARAVLRAVPGAAAAGGDNLPSLRQTVRDAEEELAPLEHAHAEQQSAAESRRNVMVWGGLA